MESVNRSDLIRFDFDKKRIGLTDPVAMPKASGFLWNPKMMLQMNCRGYATAQFMQPEPAKYSQSPVNEAQGFMQPEPEYFSHSPGRFFYVKDIESGDTFSLPYEPMRDKSGRFEFSQGNQDIHWRIIKNGLEFIITVQLPVDQTVELWSVSINNTGDVERNLAIYPCFSIGYMSWMNQSADFDDDLNAVVAKKVSPYQKVEEYFSRSQLREYSFLLSDMTVTSWTTSLSDFIGQGDLSRPDALQHDQLNNQRALYETPVAVVRHELCLKAGNSSSCHYVFGAAVDMEEISALKALYLDDREGFTKASQQYASYINNAEGCIQEHTPDERFNQMVN